MVSPSSLVVAGIRTHLLSGGKGQPLIFLHGMGASSYGWRRLLPAFAKTHAVYAPDLPGFGRSEKPRDFDYSLVGFTRWLNSFMDTLGLPQAVLIGSSMGGAISIALALDHPARVSRLVLIGTPVDERHIPRIIRIMRTPLLGRLLEPLLGPWLVRVVAPTAFLDQNLVTEELIQEYAIALQTREGRHSIAETMRPLARRRASGAASKIRTENPRSAQSSAKPEPMVPAPTIPTVLTLTRG